MRQRLAKEQLFSGTTDPNRKKSYTLEKYGIQLN